MEVDLNINNSVGIRNTHLLNAYARLDWRVAPLVLFTKHWARHQNINDASQSTISSYSLGLMVIHYLQCKLSNYSCINFEQMFIMRIKVRFIFDNKVVLIRTNVRSENKSEIYILTTRLF